MAPKLTKEEIEEHKRQFDTGRTFAEAEEIEREVNNETSQN